MADRESPAAPGTSHVNRDVVHPALKSVRRVPVVEYEFEEVRRLLHEELETLLLARKQRRIQDFKVLPRLPGVLQGMQDEGVGQPDGVLRIALATLQRVDARRQDPEVPRTRARELPTLSTAVFAAHLPKIGP
jgi:hypothetical protein